MEGSNSRRTGSGMGLQRDGQHVVLRLCGQTQGEERPYLRPGGCGIGSRRKLPEQQKRRLSEREQVWGSS